MRKHEPNSIILINAKDLIADEEYYVNKISGRPVKAKRMSGKFIVTNERGYECSGDPGDWLVEEDGKFFSVWDAVFKGNYVKEKL